MRFGDIIAVAIVRQKLFTDLTGRLDSHAYYLTDTRFFRRRLLIEKSLNIYGKHVKD
jgi:hypothetical protein